MIHYYGFSETFSQDPRVLHCYYDYGIFFLLEGHDNYRERICNNIGLSCQCTTLSFKSSYVNMKYFQLFLFIELMPS